MMPPALFDSHAHLDHLNSDDLTAMLQRARDAGVGGILAIGGSSDANARTMEIARQNRGVISAAVGYDRGTAALKPDLSALDSLFADAVVSAAGECGLDYYYERDTASAQKTLFVEMTRLAVRHGRPLVVHSRDADEDTLSILRDAAAAHPDPARLGVVHCFTGGLDFARRALDLGLHISFSGIVTFRKAESLREVARFVPADRLLIETDSPYLAPEPLRGRKNEPSYLPHVAGCLAEVRNMPLDRLVELTTANARRLFKI